LVTILAAALALAGGCAAMRSGLFNEPGKAERARAVATTPEAGDLNEAVVLISNLQYARAAEKLVDLLERLEGSADKDAPITAETTFWLGYCREKQGRANDAVHLYNKVIQQFPGTSAANMAKQRLPLVSVFSDKP